MLLGNRKNQEREQNWSLVLNPVSNEIDKHKLAQKISEAFKLSLDESLDLVNNTPIILLDNLTRAIADSVKIFFETMPAELFLTNDVYLKRKCYRTVWPEQPSLSFLGSVEESTKKETVATVDRRLAPEEALNEVRSIQSESAVKTQKVQNSDLQRKEAVPSHLSSEVSKKETDFWRQKFEELEREASALRSQLKENTRRSAAQQNDAARIQSFEQEASRLKAAAKSADQKCEAIQEEYRQARALYENKIVLSQEEARKWKTKLDEGSQKLRLAADDSLKLEKRMLEGEREVESLRAEKSRFVVELDKLRKQFAEEQHLRSKAEHLHDELSREETLLRQEFEKMRLRTRDLEQTLQSRQFSLEEAARKLRAAEESRALIEQERAAVQQEAEEFSAQCGQLESELENRSKALEAALSEGQSHAQKNRDLAVLLQEAREQADVWMKRSEREEVLRKDEIEKLQSESARLQSERDALSETLARETVKVLDLEKNLMEQADELAKWRSNSEGFSVEIDKLRLLLGDEKIFRDKLEERLARSDDERNFLQTDLAESKVRLNALQSEYQSARLQFEKESKDLTHESEELRGEVSQLQEKNETLEKSRLRLVKETEEALRQTDEWKLKAKDLEHAASDLERRFLDEIQSRQDKEKRLEDRERDLETVRKQNRDLVVQLEQRDLMHRRNQLAEQMTQREEKLKGLIQEQAQLEAEMRQKEEKMRVILAEQERIEKEIVESKQAQRHHLEQTKRERSPKVVRPSILGKSSPLTDTDSDQAHKSTEADGD